MPLSPDPTYVNFTHFLINLYIPPLHVFSDEESKFQAEEEEVETYGDILGRDDADPHLQVREKLVSY